MSEPAVFFCIFVVAMPVAIGYGIPPRAAPWTIIGSIGVIVLSLAAPHHNIHNPWRLFVAIAALSLILGNAIRLAHAQIVAGRRTRAERK